jgi:hypothetical protein
MALTPMPEPTFDPGSSNASATVQSATVQSIPQPPSPGPTPTTVPNITPTVVVDGGSVPITPSYEGS